MSVVLALLLLSAAARVCWLQSQVRRYDLVREDKHGLLHVELRRKAALTLEPRCSQAFPLPRESRVRVTRVVGVPVWRDERSIGLPMTEADRIDTVPVDAFDAQFAPTFRATR